MADFNGCMCECTGMMILQRGLSIRNVAGRQQCRSARSVSWKLPRQLPDPMPLPGLLEVSVCTCCTFDPLKPPYPSSQPDLTCTSWDTVTCLALNFVIGRDRPFQRSHCVQEVTTRSEPICARLPQLVGFQQGDYNCHQAPACRSILQSLSEKLVLTTVLQLQPVAAQTTSNKNN